jgi:hypothetical protein
VSSNKQEGAPTDDETLAIFLACGTNIRSMPEDRIDLLELWEAKKPEVRVAYRLRATRLLRAWARMMRPDMHLDAADLAGIEIDSNATELERRLVEEIRWYQEEDERIRAELTKAKDEAKDAGIALGHLRSYLTDPQLEADRYADEIEECLDNIQELDDG